jgi:chaperonin GroEL (HSP60 family)
MMDQTLPPSKQILVDALQVPFVRIMQNAGVDAKVISDAASSITKNQTEGIPSVVYDCFNHDYVNPFEAGILDPVKVTISALSNAMSIAEMLMTIGGALVIPRDTTEERAAELQAQQIAATMQGA